MSSGDEVLAAAVRDVLHQRDDRGARRFTDDVVRHFVAWSLVQAVQGAKPSSLNADALLLLGETCAAAGVVQGDAPDALVAKLRAFFEARPPHPDLVARVDAMLRDLVAAGAAPSTGAAFARFAGVASSKGVLGGGVRPEGTAPGGPLGRLAFTSKKPDPTR